MTLIEWSKINSYSVPSVSGVYAWYYRPKIGEKDVNELFGKMSASTSPNEKRECIKDFLNKYIYESFQEDPYSVSIYGPLKPTYEGKISQVISGSDSIVEKIINRPELIRHIQKTLGDISHEFYSPLYIGMSSNLSDRINKHKRLIEDYSNRHPVEVYEKDQQDENFASRVAKRGFIQAQLLVVIKQVPLDDGAHNVVENILNRINFPILGRN